MSDVEGTETLDLRSSDDIVRVRRRARDLAVELGYGSTDQTRVMTAASELARNTVTHGSGGTVRIETVREGERVGLRLVFEDRGPGIGDQAEAFRDGFSSRRGLGRGLGGSRRLGDEMEIDSTEQASTRVTWLRWKR